MRFLDLFAGIGGFRLGMQQAGHECAGYVEWDKFARKSYEAIHDAEGEWTANDITAVGESEIEQFRGTVDIICGGFPCQAFSLAGQRKGFEDTRGTLFFEIARFARVIRPKYLFLENVKGLLNHDGGNTFRTILGALDELGYDAEWQVLNSKNFGVPQNRERVFIVGHLRGERTGKIFPFEGSSQPIGIEILGSTAPPQRTIGSRDVVYNAKGIMSTLLSSDYKQPKQIMVAGDLNHYNNDQMNRIYSPEGISPTITVVSGGGREHKIVCPTALTERRTEEAKKIRRESMRNGKDFSPRRGKEIVPRGDGLANCVTSTQTVEQTLLTSEYRIRKLTPRECWRLQGFPDWAFDKAKEVNSDSQLYKQAGNSVTVNVIHEIAKRLGADE